MPLLLAIMLLFAGSYKPVTKYDPGRDANKDIKEAVVEAQRTGKRVLLEIGGDWCKWCHIMDDYFEKNSKLTTFRDANFITVKINFSPQNENAKVLSQYPKVPGYPHLFVVGSDGALLHSQFTGDLEEGESYNLKKFSDFLNSWVPAKR